MRAACILTLALGLTLAAPANAQFSYPAHGVRTLDTDEADRSPPASAETGDHLLDPPSGAPAPGYHLLDPPSVTPVAPASGWDVRPPAAAVEGRPTPQSRSYNQRPPNRAGRQQIGTTQSIRGEAQTVCLTERGCTAR